MGEPKFFALGASAFACVIIACVSTTATWCSFRVENDGVGEKYRLGLWRGRLTGPDDDDFVVNKNDNGIEGDWYWSPVRPNRASTLLTALVGFGVGVTYCGLGAATSATMRMYAVEWACGLLFVFLGVFAWIAVVHFIDKVDNEFTRSAVTEDRECEIGCQLQLGLGFLTFALGITMISIANNVPFVGYCAIHEMNPHFDKEGLQPGMSSADEENMVHPMQSSDEAAVHKP